MFDCEGVIVEYCDYLMWSLFKGVRHHVMQRNARD